MPDAALCHLAVTCYLVHMTTSEKVLAPPYVSFRTFTNFVERLESEGIPQQLDRSFWGDRLSGAYGAQLMAALRFLKFIDKDNRPTALLAQFVSEKDERRGIMASLLEVQYPDVFKIGLSNATPKQFRDAFDKYTIAGPTLRKARTFFLHAAVYAGVPLSSFITKEVKQRNAESMKRPTRKTTVKKKAGDRITVTEGGSVVVVDPALEGRPLLSAVMSQLPRTNTWQKDDRDRWLRLFTEALDWDVKLVEMR
jgi:hypothetical protein